MPNRSGRNDPSQHHVVWLILLAVLITAAPVTAEIFVCEGRKQGLQPVISLKPKCPRGYRLGSQIQESVPGTSLSYVRYQIQQSYTAIPAEGGYREEDITLHCDAGDSPIGIDWSFETSSDHVTGDGMEVDLSAPILKGEDPSAVGGWHLRFSLHRTSSGIITLTCEKILATS